MKHHDPRRPIGKCKGCCLNFRTLCAAGLEPKAQWDTGRCTHYGDARLLLTPPDRVEPTGAKLARARRKAKADESAGQPHYDGMLDPARLSGRSRRNHR